MKRKFKVISILMAAILVLGGFSPVLVYADVVYDTDNTPPIVATGSIASSSSTHHSVNLSWAPAEDTVTEAVYLQYKVIYSEENNISTVTDAVYNGITAQNWTNNLTFTEVADLDPDTMYYFNVIVQDEAENKNVYTTKAQKTQALTSSARAMFGGENGTELFLGGNYIELGISNWGDFGTLGEKPDNFRGTKNGEVGSGGSDQIGMSADHDGFNNGYDLPVDYYLPGTPEERFVVGYQVGETIFTNTNSAQENDKNMSTIVINQSDTEKGLLGAEVISTWDEKMEITQIISFRTDDKFYRNEITLKNISGETWDGARYMRSFDPDNTKYRGGPYDTRNIVTHTIAEDNKAVVKAETYDDNDPLYLAFGSRAPIFFYSNNPAAVASIFGFANKNPYHVEAYETPHPKRSEIIDDIAITIAWDSGVLAPEESKTFVYYTSLDERDFDDVQGEIIIADIKKDIEDMEDMDDVKDVKDKINGEEDLDDEKKEEFKGDIIDEVCKFPPVKDIPLRDDEDINVIRDLIKESDKEDDEKDDRRLDLVDKAIEDIGGESLTEEDKNALEKVIDDIGDEDKKDKAKSKLEGIDEVNNKKEIEKEIEGAEKQEDIQEIYEKIEDSTLSEEDKEELKGKLVDKILDEEDIPLKDYDDIDSIRKIIKESDKENDEKDDRRLDLIDKAIEDIGGENLTEEDKTALEEVIEDIGDEDKKEEAKSKLEGIENIKNKTKIEKEIEDAEDQEDIQEIYEKIKDSTLPEEDKEELKGKLVDKILDEEVELDIKDKEDVKTIKEIIEGSDKEDDEKDEAYEKLVLKGLDDLTEDEDFSDEEKEALEEVIKKIISEEKKEELTNKLALKDEELRSENNGNSSKGGSSKSKEPSSEEMGIIVIVNGKEQKAGVEIVTEKNGQKIVEIRTDSSVLNQKIDEVLKENGGKAVNNLVEMPVLSKDSTLIKGILTGDIVKKMEQNDFSLSITTEKVDYIIPSKEIGIEQVASILGVNTESFRNIEVLIEIEKINEKQAQEIARQGKIQGYEILVPPVEFKVVANTTTDSGDVREVTVSKFSSYVSRVMEIPEDIDPNRITTGIYFNQDGTFSHIPTEVFQREALWYAKLNSLTNSSYSVIWNPVSVESVENHWSKEHVNDMASRLIIKSPEDFTPDTFITRGEFAEYIIKAIGLYRTGVAKVGQFTDVMEPNGQSDAITIATEYGIITGYPDGTFMPDAKISREEAMTMYARAMDIVNLREADNNKISSYTDKDQIADWAYDFVKKTVSANVFSGKTAETIDPKGTFTHAEAATAIRNLLINSGLINQ